MTKKQVRFADEIKIDQYTNVDCTESRSMNPCRARSWESTIQYSTQPKTKLVSPPPQPVRKVSAHVVDFMNLDWNDDDSCGSFEECESSRSWGIEAEVTSSRQSRESLTLPPTIPTRKLSVTFTSQSEDTSPTSITSFTTPTYEECREISEPSWPVMPKIWESSPSQDKSPKKRDRRTRGKSNKRTSRSPVSRKQRRSTDTSEAQPQKNRTEYEKSGASPQLVAHKTLPCSVRLSKKRSGRNDLTISYLPVQYHTRTPKPASAKPTRYSLA